MNSLVLHNKYLPDQYDLVLDINDTKPNFQGQVSFKLAENPRYVQSDNNKDKLLLHSSNLVIISAFVGEKKIDVTVDRENETIEMTLGEHVLGETVTIKYFGSVKTMTSFEQTKGLFKFDVDDRVVISCQAQPIFSRMVYPNIDELHLKLPVKLQVNTNKRFVVVGNNAVESESVQGEIKSTIFKATPPMLPSNFTITIGDLEVVESTAHPIRVYCIKEFVLKAPNVLDICDKLFPVLVSHFGHFPLSKLDIIGVPYLTEGAMENWGAITVMQDHLFKDDKLMTEQLISHEMVHQWIGNLVSFDDWKYLWLNESFATFFGNYFVSLVDKDYDMTEEWINITTRVLGPDNTNIEKFMNSLVIDNQATTSYFFNHQVYEKGILILRMIGNILNPEHPDNFETFANSFKKFIELYKFQTIKPMDLWKFYLEEFDIDLVNFVNMWIRYDKYPILQISHKEEELTIEQMQSKVYHFPLPIKTTTNTYQLYITEKTTKVKIPVDEIITVNQDKIALAKQEINKKIMKHVDSKNFGKLDALSYLIDYPDEKSEFNRRLKGIYKKESGSK